MFSPIEIAAVVGVAILVFGADKLPKLAREEARRAAQADARTAEATTTVGGAGQPGPLVPDPITGAPGPTHVAPPQQ
jgi:hypothetical protein